MLFKISVAAARRSNDSNSSYGVIKVQSKMIFPCNNHLNSRLLRKGAHWCFDIIDNFDNIVLNRDLTTTVHVCSANAGIENTEVYISC